MENVTPYGPWTLATLLTLTEATHFVGEAVQPISGLATLQEATPTDLSFLGNLKYRPQLAGCRAGAVLVPLDTPGAPPDGQAWLFCHHPSLSLAKLCASIEAARQPAPQSGVHPTAVIDATAEVDPTASIGPHCVVGAGASIGPRTVLDAGVVIGAGSRVGADGVLHPRVVLYPRTRLSDRVVIHAGAVIGSDGFGYETVNGVHQKVPQIGCVVIEDDVEIGANTTIDRARFGETRIGRGSKLDNLVQVAHNVVIGAGSILCAQVGISGSTTLGKYVVLAGQVGVAGHLHLGDQTTAGGQAGIHQNTLPGTYLRGSPALPAAQANRADILHSKLPELAKRLRALESVVATRNAAGRATDSAIDAAG